MTTITTTQDRVRNYQGQNSFLLKLKGSLQQWGGLTQKQIIAAEKCLNDQPKSLDLENLPEDIKRIVDYQGQNPFVLDIQSKFKTYGTLTNNQIVSANKTIHTEENKANTIHMNWFTPGETLLIGRNVGQTLKENYGLEFNPTLIDLTKLLAVSPKAIKFAGKLTSKKSKICSCCGKTLTDEFSMLTNVGPICAKNMGIEYIKDASQVEEFRQRYMERVEELGEFEFWVPKSQIRVWDGSTKHILKMI